MGATVDYDKPRGRSATTESPLLGLLSFDFACNRLEVAPHVELSAPATEELVTYPEALEDKIRTT